MVRTMKALVKATPGPGAQLLDVEVPRVKPGHLLVRVLATAICGTDIHIYDWTEWAQKRIKPPMVFGHEFSGEVVEVGEGVTQAAPGDLVAGETHIPCGDCYQCRTGLQHVCQRMAILGVHTPGVFSEYALIPEACAWKLPPGTPPEVGAVYEPFGVATHAVLAEDVSAKSVAVFGCGPIGLYAVAVARACGAAKVIACEVSPERLAFAEKLGATHLLNPRESNAVEAIFEITGGVGVDVGVELSGAPAALRQVLAAMTRGGRLSIAGLQARPVEIDVVDDIVYKELRVYGVTGRVMYGTWYKVASLIQSGLVDPRPVTTHRFKMSEVDAAMDTAKTGKAGKVILAPEV
ncbi:MAG: L-threonine 3-dehydrogenase [Firmicutes bacterium]|nr:L-threonine 3-dehydrogenase [Bacillota bacterium]